MLDLQVVLQQVLLSIQLVAVVELEKNLAEPMLMVEQPVDQVLELVEQE